VIALLRFLIALIRSFAIVRRVSDLLAKGFSVSHPKTILHVCIVGRRFSPKRVARLDWLHFGHDFGTILSHFLEALQRLFLAVGAINLCRERLVRTHP